MKTIAVVGASSEHRKYGNKCVRAYLEKGGWRVFPVNPHESEIEGLAVYPSVAELPERPDRVAVYLPPPTTREVLPAIAEAGPGEVIFNPGSWDAAVLTRARQLDLPHRTACAIVDIGLSPGMFP